ncbi:MAG: xylulose kinase, partial [Propionibacteriaceae bacterium]
GGGAQSNAVRRIAPEVLGLPVSVPEHGEYVADGAARQAAWALSGTAEAPMWKPRLQSEFMADHHSFIEDRYLDVAALATASIPA